MGRRDTISLTLAADIAEYAKGVSEVPGVTEKQAAKAALAWAKQQDKLAAASEKAAKKSATFWSNTYATMLGNMAADFARKLPSDIWGRLKDVEEARRNLAKLSQDTTISTDRLDGLRLAVRSAGEDFDDIGDSLRDFSEMMFDFSNGGGRAEETMSALNVQVLDASGNLRDSGEVFEEVVGKLQDMDDAGKRAAFAQQLMGDNGAKMLRSLDGRRLAEWVGYAQEFGLKVGPEAAMATRQWEQATNELQVVLDSTIANVANAFGAEDAAGLLRRFTTGFVAASTWLGEWGSLTVTRMKSISSEMGTILSEMGKTENAAAKTVLGAVAGTPGRLLVDAYNLVNPSERQRAAMDELSQIMDFSEDVSAATDRAMERVKALWAMQKDADASSGGKSSGGSGSPMEREADRARAAADDASEQLGELYRDLQERNLEGIAAIDARYDRELERIGELMEASQEYATAKLATEELERQRMEEKAVFEAELAKQVADAHIAALERRRAMAERIAAEEAAQRQATIQGVAAISGAFGDLTGAVLEGYGRQTGASKRSMQQQAAAAKLFAVFDLGLKQAQAVANVMSKADPYTMLGFVATTIGTFAGLFSTINSLQVPKAHGGSGIHGVGAGGMWTPDEQLTLTKRHEVIVDAPTVREVGGPQAVRDRLDGDSDRPMRFVLDFGDEAVEVIGRRSTTGSRMPVDLLGWAT